MIPEFPKFKKLELSDKEDIEYFTQGHLPYSDFNFVSMWSWDTKRGMRVSQLNKNLVIKFTDYVTGDAHYSFIGANDISDTAKKLLDLSHKEGVSSKLRFIPEHSIENIDRNIFEVKEDRDNFDYIISVKELSEYNTKETRSRRKSVNQFIKNHPNYSVSQLDLSDQKVQKIIFNFFVLSRDKSKGGNKTELLALSRFLNNSKDLEHFSMGIFLGNKLVGLYIGEFVGEEYTIGHFWKSNTKISTGLYAFLMQNVAKFCNSNGYKYINIEQDLGISNLRKWKMSYASNSFLKKYEISFKNNVGIAKL